MKARYTSCRFSATASASFVLFLLVMTSSAQCKQTADDIAAPRPAELRFQYAREAAQAGDFKCAMQEYSRLVLDEPDNVDYVFGYAQVLFWSGNLERSLRFLEQARKLAPDYEEIWKLEYRARNTQARNQSSASVDQFRQMAAARFPGAEWHRKTGKTVSRKYRWEFSAGREYLDNGAPDWEQVSALLGRNLAEKALVTLSASTLNRFGTRDTQFGIGGSLEVGENWTATGGFAVSSSPNFLPDNAMDLGLSRRFERGWVGGARWRRRDYENASVDLFGFITERYFGKYRIAYSLDRAHLSSEHVLVFDEDVGEPGAFVLAVHFGEIIIGRIVIEAGRGAPGEIAVRQVVAEIQFGPAILRPADRAHLAGERIADAGDLEAQLGVEPGAGQAQRRELDRAGALQPEARRARQIADAFAIRADRHDVDDVLDGVIVSAQPGLARGAQCAADLHLRFPALRGDEFRIAAILPF